MQDSLKSSSYQQLEQKSKYTNIFLRWFLYFILILFASYFIFPLYVMVVTSLKTMEEIRQGTLLSWPSGLNLESWAVAWGGRGYGAGDTFLRPYFWNSIKMVVPAVFFSTFIGAMTGYVLTKWRFKGDQWVFLFIIWMFHTFSSNIVTNGQNPWSIRNFKFSNWVSFSSYSLWNTFYHIIF